MRIGIVTVYNTENSGSALQAYALTETLKRKGLDVYCLYRPVYDTQNSFMRCVLSVIKSILKLQFKQARHRIKRHIGFKKFTEKYFEVRKEVPPEDMLIFGSDTLWNIKDLYFERKRDFFWGKDIDNYKVSYAVSVGNTNCEAFDEEYYIKQIKEFSHISVRDEQSFQAISGITSNKVEIVCDPTLLLKKEDYEILYEKANNEKYILIYYFGKMSEQQVKNIKQFAYEKQLKLVALGVQREWCDHWVVGTPDLFLKYFSGAQYIITNTFHGCVFSTIFKKQYIAFVEEKLKASDYLQRIGCAERIVNETNNYIEIMQSKIEYDVIEQKMEKLRGKSLIFLDDVIQRQNNK